MSNHHSPSTGLSALLALALLAVTVAAADESSTALIRRVCGSTQAANPPPFDVNFVDTMETISQNISGARFAAASSGNDPSDRVYGLGQCFGYLSQTDCGLCYAESRVKLPLCLPSNSARVYLSGCFLRYENNNFSQQAVDGSDSSVCGSPKGVKDRAKFRETAIGLIGNLTNGAYEDGDYYREGNASSSSPSRVTVYGIAQCWRSLNKSGCRKCLESAQTRIVGCLPASDGKALNAGCFVRYSLEPFFVGSSRSSSKSSSVKHRHRLAAGLGASFAAAVVIGAAFLWSKKRSSTGNDNFTNTEGSSEIYKLIAESGLGFKYDELRNATDYFSLQNKLGQGGYGTVYKGVLPDGRDIAVKRLFFHTTQFVDQFFNEVNLISQVQHKNLAKLLGCSIEGPESLLVYEYLPNTSLDHFLFDSYRKIILDWERRLEILVGTAEGLAYLHEASEVRIIHRDIKASNVLLDEKFKPKIADFGLARYFAEDQSHLSTGIAGTIGYMAPEYVIHGQLTEKADVYSYGVLVHEVLTGRRNASSVPASSEGHSLVSQIWEHFSSSTLIEMLDPNLQGQCSEEQAVKVFHVGLLCTQASSNLRPTMRKVVEMMATKRKDLPLPTEPPFIDLKGMELKFGFGSSETSLKYSSSSKPSSSKPPGSVNQMSFSIMQGR